MIGQKTATVFGGTGFLGHAVVQALARQGFVVRVPTRDLEKAKDLRVLGQVGQIVPLRASIRTDASVAAALEGSDVVVNLIGILAEDGKNTFQRVHVETAARLARLAKAEGVKHFIHVSALGADKTSRSLYARTKARGENAVHAFFPNAVLLRPSLMFGPRDRFFNRLTHLSRFLPILPLIGNGETKLQPVFVGDVAAAVLASMNNPALQGRSFALGGPAIYTLKEMILLILNRLNRRRLLLPLPWRAAKALALFLERLPGEVLTRDQVECLKTDNIVPARKNGMGTLADLGITATAFSPEEG